ncbi:peptidylprolyl isomerase [Campylobacter mucosalis]|uniref:peptidylprolyl isomerase n=1 Tax=Campylobacter mucosalis TaxID=202 RepID=UPI0004D64CC5|nr:peptidylprolyl isomerase [Campylobacter mucosalis]KEA46354.1 peptidylprolyl isomerase [Campylobacter mucosalis]QKF63168.1 putative periplasmic folding chaperone [Campylobacter mucosalis]
MITWMQRHKKYLVVTIWISTIAFVGAGFVGWGAYDMNSNRATSVAKVGHRNVSVQDLNDKYSQLYSYYNNIFEGKLTQEKAAELGLENLALKSSIQESLLLNFADDIGLSVSDDDIIRYIASDENFHKDGKFDKNLYYDTLRRSRINPKDYEQSLRRVILIDKLRTALKLDVTKDDIDLLNASFSMQDVVGLSILSVNPNDIKVDEAELKELWEKSKNNYMTKTIYNLETLFVPSKNLDANETALSEYYNENKSNYRDNEDKILPFESAKDMVAKDLMLEQTKSLALEKYVGVKKGEIKTDGFMSFDEDNATLPIDEFKDAKVADVLKPIIYKDGYMIARIKDIVAPTPMGFEKAREYVKVAYIAEKSKKILDEKSKDTLKNFDVKNATKATISRDKIAKIDGLTDFEVSNFIAQVFNSPNKKGYIVLGEKAVIYEILEQKLLTNKDISNALVFENMAMLKNNELMQDLTKELQKRYKVEEYIKR